MKTPEEIKRDMAKCAKRAKQVIMYSCDVEEMAEYTETVSNTLIVGRSLIQQLEQDNAQKDERIRELEKRVPRWISVEERLPERVEVLAVNDRNTMMIGLVEFRDYDGTRFCVCEDIDSGIGITHVTHWMPLPEPPEEDDHATG